MDDKLKRLESEKDSLCTKLSEKDKMLTSMEKEVLVLRESLVGKDQELFKIKANYEESIKKAELDNQAKLEKQKKKVGFFSCFTG